MSATGVEADGPPDATLTHRLALIAKADHLPNESAEAGALYESQALK